MSRAVQGRRASGLNRVERRIEKFGYFDLGFRFRVNEGSFFDERGNRAKVGDFQDDSVAIHDLRVDSGFDFGVDLNGKPDFQGDYAIFENDVSADQGASGGYRREKEVQRVVDCY